MFSNKLIKGLTIIALSAGFSLSTIQSAFARPGTLSNVPLFLSSIVEPNVFLTMDDSGSMDWGPMQSADSGVAAGSNGLPVIDTRRRAYYTPTFSNLYGTNNCYFVVPPFTNGGADGGVAAWDASWVVRHHLANRTYYNPAETYEPWRGTNSDGTPMYEPAKEKAAEEHPDGTEETIDLTVMHTYTEPTSTNGNCQSPNAGLKAPMWVPTYYTWPDNNGDGVIDARDIGDGDNILEAGDMTTAEIKAAEVRIVAGTAEMQNFANWFQYYRSRMNAAKAILGSTINNTDASRVGLRWFNDGHQMNVESMSDPDNKRDLQTVLYDYDTRGQGTPARRALRNTGRYFDATDGYTYNAINGNDIEPILPKAQGGECQQNFNILMSDGFWNSSNGPGVGNTDLDNSGATDNGFDGDKNESVDDGFYEDPWSNTLADVAMKYYEEDLSNLANNVPTTADVDEADHQHLVTYTVAFGLQGTPGLGDPLSEGFSWPEPKRNTLTTVDDMQHAAYNGRGLYLSAGNPGALLASLNTAIADIADRTASAAAVSINTTKLNVDTVVYLAEFNTNRWHGDLKAFKIRVLDNGTPSDPTDDFLDPSGTLNAFPEWRASTQLDARWKPGSPGSVSPERVIYTYDGTQGTPFKKLTNLTPGQQADLNTGPTGTADGVGQLRLDYLRGDRSLEGNGFRERLSLLGDLVNSGPVYVGAPGLNWPDTAPFPTGANRYSDFKIGPAASRAGVIYAAANDGMLHGFAEADGEEVMAYIPNNLFSSATGEGMHYLTEPNYNHRYYNDLTPTLSDIYADLGDGLAWQTILINGERGGGRGIYALNVNDPNNFTDAKADKIALWEFSSQDNANLGYTYSQPQIAFTNGTPGRWVAIFGNGYNNLGDGKAKLFVLDIEGGMDGWDAGDVIEIDTGEGTTGDPNGLSTPRLADLDGDGTVDRVYAGDVHGNMWAFDMSGGSTPSIVGGAPIFTTIGNEPITTPPVLAKHPTISNDGTNYPNVMVYFGSGQYLTNADKTDTSLNHFYGIWDNAAQNISALHKQTFLNGYTDTFGNPVRVLTNTPVNYAGGESGWYWELEDPGEKLIFEPSLRGGIVFANTFVPDPDPCGEGGDSWAMFVDMVNGGSADGPQSDTNNDGVIDDKDRVSNSSGTAALMTSSGSKGEGELYPNNNFLGDLVYRGDDPDEVKELRDIPTGRFSWQELIQ